MVGSINFSRCKSIFEIISLSIFFFTGVWISDVVKEYFQCWCYDRCVANPALWLVTVTWRRRTAKTGSWILITSSSKSSADPCLGQSRCSIWGMGSFTYDWLFNIYEVMKPCSILTPFWMGNVFYFYLLGCSHSHHLFQIYF